MTSASIRPGVADLVGNGRSASPPLTELDRVAVTVVVESDDGTSIPAGSKGTVVAIWGDGYAYDVEFTKPHAALATVRATDLQAISQHP